jgi:hypothetical protein
MLPSQTHQGGGGGSILRSFISNKLLVFLEKWGIYLKQSLVNKQKIMFNLKHIDTDIKHWAYTEILAKLSNHVDKPRVDGALRNLPTTNSCKQIANNAYSYIYRYILRYINNNTVSFKTYKRIFMSTSKILFKIISILIIK